ncbi:MAG TPA: hypothetical protein PLB12_05620 [Candidatus Goldiibacteriota bacterium]|nr:hypothetical protein [Candidatus Goldiibacteriota bacterium]HPN64632.1 hypothetical protein [Candidatus Goldiibacteriota bacterium]HRQ43813.1 hypothetical protein [Candidatus Goldiibacteriota bacterium]
MKKMRFVMLLFVLFYSGTLFAAGAKKSVIFNEQTLNLTCTSKTDGNYTLEYIPADQRIGNFERKLTLCYYPSMTITAAEHGAVLKSAVKERLKSGDPVASAQVMNLGYAYNNEAAVYIVRSYNDFSKYEKSIVYVKKMLNGIMTAEFARRYTVKNPTDSGVEKFDDEFFKQEEKYLAALRTAKWPMPTE